MGNCIGFLREEGDYIFVSGGLLSSLPPSQPHLLQCLSKIQIDFEVWLLTLCPGIREFIPVRPKVTSYIYDYHLPIQYTYKSFWLWPPFEPYHRLTVTVIIPTKGESRGFELELLFIYFLLRLDVISSFVSSLPWEWNWMWKGVSLTLLSSLESFLWKRKEITTL